MCFRDSIQIIPLQLLLFNYWDFQGNMKEHSEAGNRKGKNRFKVLELKSRYAVLIFCHRSCYIAIKIIFSC